MIPRIAILGGSSVYIPELVHSIIAQNLAVNEIVLVGRSQHKLELVSQFCQRLLDKSGFPCRVEGTSDIDKGVKDAKYILNNIRAGGMLARIRDEKTPTKFGMLGDESMGAGGFSNALRTLPVIMEYATHIENTNPDAILINLTNPMGICVEALSHYSKLHVVGICDLPRTCIRKISALMRIDPAELEIDYIGLNHLGWIQDIRHNSISVMGRLLEKIEEEGDDSFDKACIALFRMIPAARMCPYFHRDTLVHQQKTMSRFRGEVLHEAEQQILRLYEDERLSEVPDLTRARNALWYEDIILPLIHALEGEESHELIVCVENKRCIRDLPETCSIETPAKVSVKGVKPKKTGSCPHFLKGLFYAVKESERLTIETVRHKSYECALQALAVNPLVPSIESARAYLDHLIKEEHFELH